MDAQGNIKSVTFNLSKDKAIADPEKTVAEGYLFKCGLCNKCEGNPLLYAYSSTSLSEIFQRCSIR